ncbi:MAG: TadE/TadG family type IV pilus assembly protein [Chloroflexota bacterium]
MSVFKSENKNSGQALVEFALIIIVLLMLIFLIIELGRIAWAWSAVQNAARSGARYAITGQSVAGICDTEPVGCLARSESVEQVALQSLTGWTIRQDVEFQDNNFTAIEIFGFNSALNGGEMQRGFAGEPGQPVVVRVTYNVPVVTPLLRPIVENVPVFGQITLTNELFGQTGGRTEGAALPPPIPAIPKLGPTDTPTPTFTPTPVPSIPPGSTPTPIETSTPVITCDVKIQGTLIEGQRILTFTGDRFVDNFAGNSTYTIEVIDVTNGEIIASGVPMQNVPTTFVGSHGCVNGNEGYVEIDLGTAPDYYINPIYAGGLPGGIQIVVQHENGSEDDEFVITAANATATVLAPTLTPLPSETPTPTPDWTPTPAPPGPFITFPDGSNCVTPNPSTRFSIIGGNWVPGNNVQFIWDNNEVIGNATSSVDTGSIDKVDFDLGARGAGSHTLTAVDPATGDFWTMNILIPCPAPTATVTPSPTPTLSPPDLEISIPQISSSSPITEFTRVEFSFAISNTGQTDVNSLFFVDLFLDPPPIAFVTETDPITRTYIIADPYSDGFIAVPDMPANSSQVITITSPIGFQNDTTGAREAWGMVDSINSIINEEEEDNNLSTLGNIAVTPAVDIPTPTPIPSEESDPFSIRGRVKALYTEFVPQQRATVFLVEQPSGGGQGIVRAQTVTDANGRYRFYDVPELTGGDSYTLVACLSLAGGKAYSGFISPVLPDATEAVFKDIYMTISSTGCAI